MSWSREPDEGGQRPDGRVPFQHLCRAYHVEHLPAVFSIAALLLAT
jgi:hypothetical protein